MTDVYVQAEGIFVQLDLVCVDQNNPSSPCWRVDLELSHPTGHFAYTADDVWIDTAVWDAFVLELAKGVWSHAIFHDLSEYFVLRFERKEHYFEVSITVREPIAGKGDLNMSAKYTVDLDSVFVDRFRDGFAAYSKFW